MRRSCSPNSGSHQHGPPLLGRVRTPPRSPTSTLLCSPPTPSSPSAAAPVVPRQRPTSARGLVLPRRTAAPATRYDAGDISTPAPHSPAPSRGETRASQVPGPSSSCVPCSSTPPGAMRPSPRSRCARCCLQALRDPQHPECIQFRGSTHSRPTRSRAYASPDPLPSPAQGSLPAGRAHPWPGGFRTRWMTNKVSWCHRILQSSSTSLAWSHRRRESIGFHRSCMSERWTRQSSAYLPLFPRSLFSRRRGARIHRFCRWDCYPSP